MGASRVLAEDTQMKVLDKQIPQPVKFAQQDGGKTTPPKPHVLRALRVNIQTQVKHKQISRPARLASAVGIRMQA